MPTAQLESEHRTTTAEPYSRIFLGLAAMALAISLIGCSDPEIPGEGGYGTPAPGDAGYDSPAFGSPEEVGP